MAEHLADYLAEQKAGRTVAHLAAMKAERLAVTMVVAMAAK